MVKDKINYKGFNKVLMKEDLNEEELECYDILMDGIKEASEEEKKEVAHLIDVFIEADEKISTKCIKCGKEFDDNLVDKRIYCKDCLKKMWG